MYTDVVDTRQQCLPFALAIAFLMICLTRTPALADDDSLCAKASGQKSVENCTQLIDAALAAGTTADMKKVARLYFWRGYAYVELGRNKNAIFDFTNAIEHNPRMHGAYQYRGIAFQKEQNFKRSIVDFNIAISLAPTKPGIYFDRGYSRMHLNQFERAIWDFTKVIEDNASFASDAYNMRGYAHALSGDHNDALNDFREAIALDPTAANYQHSLGEGYFYSGSREKALVEWKRACQIATAEDARRWHKSLAKLGYYSGDIDQPCNEHTLKAFEVCAQAKCQF